MTSKETKPVFLIRNLVIPIIVLIVGGIVVYFIQGCFEQKDFCSLSRDEPSPAVTSFVPPPGQFAFATNRDGNYEIYLMNADGSGLLRLTDNPADDTYPAWSADGNWLAFTSNRDGDNEIFVMSADGANVNQITFNEAYDCCANWSPDGSRLVYNSNLPDGDQDVFVVGIDGSSPTNLTNFPGDDQRPFWSPDGTKIAFEAMRDGHADIYVMGADGSNPTRLTQLYSQQKSGISWHPNGTMIVYESNQRLDDGNSEGDINLFVMFADGSGQVAITSEMADDKNPDWSPDGKYIVYNSNRNGDDMDLYLMEWNGRISINIPNNTSYHENGATWRPNH